MKEQTVIVKNKQLLKLTKFGTGLIPFINEAKNDYIRYTIIKL